MDEHTNIREVLEELMEAKRTNAENLSQITGIPRRFINSLTEGEFDQLPAKPYVRGYLFKIAEALEVDPNFLWLAYRNTTELKASGEKDRMPSNRFAINKIRTSRVIAILAVVLVLVFLGFRFNDILGRPEVTLDIPELTSEERIVIRGSLENRRDTLSVNGEEIFADASGRFEKEVQLEPGLNTFEFRIERYLGQETTEVKQVFYQPSSSFDESRGEPTSSIEEPEPQVEEDTEFVE